MQWPLLSIINAIMYVIRTGCQWRMLPSEFPPWQTVYYHYNKWSKEGTWKIIHDTLNEKDRIICGREPTPSASIIDSQSTKTTEVGGPKGYDAGKKVNGRKRHIVVDTDGRIIAAVVHEANIQDRDGAKLVLPQLKDKCPGLKLIWADGGYAGKLIRWVKENLGYDLEIIKRSDDTKGFEILPRRWVVETMFDVLKNVMGVFRYRFWTKGLPRHSRKPRKNQSMNPAMGIDQKRKVRRCFDAYEQFVMIGAIALGLLQLISLKYQNSVWLEFQGFLRTRSRNLPSERTVKYVIANLLLLDLFSSAPKGIIREIQKYRFKKKMFKPGVLPDKRVSDPETVLSKLE